MIKENILKSIAIIFLVLPIAFLGCSGGSDSTVLSATAVRSSQSIEVLPSDYDFGRVTPGNSPAPLEVEILNNGSGALNVNDIALSDPVNFSLDLTKGLNPCGTTSPTIAAGGSCNAEVSFNPALDDSFDANLTITSNDPVAPSVGMSLSGIREPITDLSVKINQVETNCPGTVFTAYVSVTDQGGYPVTGLTAADFTITEEGGYVGLPDNPISYVGNTATLSVALVMDYSESITRTQDNVDDMEESAAAFIDQLGANDEAEIIKFADDFDVVQPFTPGSVGGKDLLKDAIYAPYNNGRETDLYDAVVQAIADVAARFKQRRAIIVITDGDNDAFLSNNDLADVINDANDQGVPIFTIGLGQDLNPDILRQMADDTGGQYYESATSDNLRTIYQQLGDVLFQDSYILTYTSGLGAGNTANLKIEATFQTIVGDDTKSITSCP